MSRVERQTINCPQCGAEHEFLMYDSLNVTLDPDKKEELLSGRLVEFKCPDCGLVAPVSYPLLYHDMDKKIMIQLIPDPARVNEHIRAYNESQSQLRETMGIDMQKDYRTRAVTDMNQLREKVLIFENDLDDRAIEFGKPVLLDNVLSNENIDMEVKDMFFGGITDEGMHEYVIFFDDGQMATFDVPTELYDNFVDIINSHMDEPEGMVVVDAGWVAMMFAIANGETPSEQNGSGVFFGDDVPEDAEDMLMVPVPVVQFQTMDYAEGHDGHTVFIGHDGIFEHVFIVDQSVKDEDIASAVKLSHDNIKADASYVDGMECKFTFSEPETQTLDDIDFLYETQLWEIGDALTVYQSNIYFRQQEGDKSLFMVTFGTIPMPTESFEADKEEIMKTVDGTGKELLRMMTTKEQ